MEVDDVTLSDELGQAIAGFVPETMKDAVFERLKAAIITGQLKPGQRLIEHRLAPMLGVSRTPLREAIRLLEQERLVERLSRGGVRVTLVSLEEMVNLNEIRCVLEVYCAQRAALTVAGRNRTDATERQIATLQSLTTEMHTLNESDDLIKNLELGKRFHEAVHQLADNAIGTGFLSQVIGAMERYRALVPPTRTAVTVQEHAAITEAILAGDVELAGELMRVHIVNAGIHYSRTIEDIQGNGDKL